MRRRPGIAGLPSIQAKLGKLYEPMAQSPLYKADVSQFGVSFKDFPAILAKVAYPGRSANLCVDL